MDSHESMAESAAQSNARARSAGWFTTSWATMEQVKAVQMAKALQPRPKRERRLTQNQIDILTAIMGGASGTLDIAARCTGTVSQVNGRADWLAEKGLIRILVGKSNNTRKRFYYITDAGRAALEREGKL